MNKFRKIFHSESPRRDWPNLRRSASKYFSLMGLPKAAPNSVTALDAARGYERTYYAKSPRKILEKNRGWAGRNSEKVAEARRIRCAHRRKTDPGYRILIVLRRRLRAALHGENKSASTLELLGCTIPKWRAHLEAQFRPGMTWENYGSVWHEDHIRPCASFDMRDFNQQRECFHYTNTQPLFAKENLQKGDKYGG